MSYVDGSGELTSGESTTLDGITTGKVPKKTATGFEDSDPYNPAALAATGGTATGLTKLGVRDTSAAYDAVVAATSSTPLTAERTLTVDLVNASRTLKVTANAEVGGTNTGDQTVTGLGLEDATFVLCGVLDSMLHPEAKAFITRHGGEV